MGDESKKNGTTGLSRRDILKAAALGLVVGPAFPMLSGPHPAHAGEADGKNAKALVAFFSHTGNTRAVASHIHDLIGANTADIQVVQPYPADYEVLKQQARQELDTGFKPPVTTKIADMGSYGVVFVGSPVWWGTIAPPVRTFLGGYDLSGKTVIPFTTHLGSGLGRCPSDIAALCPGSAMRGGLAVWGRSAKDARGNVADWLEKLGMKA